MHIDPVNLVTLPIFLLHFSPPSPPPPPTLKLDLPVRRCDPFIGTHLTRFPAPDCARVEAEFFIVPSLFPMRNVLAYCYFNFETRNDLVSVQPATVRNTSIGWQAASDSTVLSSPLVQKRVEGFCRFINSWIMMALGRAVISRRESHPVNRKSSSCCERVLRPRVGARSREEFERSSW